MSSTPSTTATSVRSGSRFGHRSRCHSSIGMSGEQARTSASHWRAGFLMVDPMLIAAQCDSAGGIAEQDLRCRPRAPSAHVPVEPSVTMTIESFLMGQKKPADRRRSSQSYREERPSSRHDRQRRLTQRQIVGNHRSSRGRRCSTLALRAERRSVRSQRGRLARHFE